METSRKVSPPPSPSSPPPKAPGRTGGTKAEPWPPRTSRSSIKAIQGPQNSRPKFVGLPKVRQKNPPGKSEASKDPKPAETPGESTPNYTTNKPNFTFQILNYRGRGRGRARPGPKPGIPYPYSNSKKTSFDLGRNSSRGSKPGPNLPQLNNQKNPNQAPDPKNSRSKLFVRIISQDTGRPKFVQNIEVFIVFNPAWQSQTASETASKAAPGCPVGTKAEPWPPWTSGLSVKAVQGRKNSRPKFVRIICQDTGRPKFVQNLEVFRVICQTYQPQTAPKTATKADQKQKILDMRTFESSKAPQPKGAAPQDPALMTSATSSAVGGQPDQGNQAGLQSEGKRPRPKLNTNLDTTYICRNRNSAENHPKLVGNPNLVEYPDSSSPDSDSASTSDSDSDSDSDSGSDSDPDLDGDIQMGLKSRNRKTKETKRMSELQNSENRNNFPTKFPPKSALGCPRGTRVRPFPPWILWLPIRPIRGRKKLRPKFDRSMRTLRKPSTSNIRQPQMASKTAPGCPRGTKVRPWPPWTSWPSIRAIRGQTQLQTQTQRQQSWGPPGPPEPLVLDLDIGGLVGHVGDLKGEQVSDLGFPLPDPEGSRDPEGRWDPKTRRLGRTESEARDGKTESGARIARTESRAETNLNLKKMKQMGKSPTISTNYNNFIHYMLPQFNKFLSKSLEKIKANLSQILPEMYLTPENVFLLRKLGEVTQNQVISAEKVGKRKDRPLKLTISTTPTPPPLLYSVSRHKGCDIRPKIKRPKR